MSARPIGDIMKPILDRCASLELLHDVLRLTHGSADRKWTVMWFRSFNVITDEEASLFLEAYQLETA
jgi:hypothetical protein